MAITFDLHVAHRNWGVVQRALKVMSIWFQDLLQRRCLRRDRRRLYEMPDYLLKDIGITRWEIDWVTAAGRGASRRRRPLQ